LLAPSNAYLHVALGRILHFTERPDDAIISIEKGMRLSPYYPANWLLFLSRAYHQGRRYEDAISAYQQLLDRSQKGEAEPLRAHAGLVLSYLELGREDEALKHAAEVFKINPDYPFLWLARRNLRYHDVQYLKHLLIPVTSRQAKPLGKERFIHTGPPNFHLEYPKGSRNLPKPDKGFVMMKSSPGRGWFGSGIYEIPPDMPLSEIGPKLYLAGLKAYGSNEEVLSNQEFTLEDGTRAYKTEIKWLDLDGATWIDTIVVSAYKDGKWIFAAVHTGGDPADLAWIPESLAFD